MSTQGDVAGSNTEQVHEDRIKFFQNFCSWIYCVSFCESSGLGSKTEPWHLKSPSAGGAKFSLPSLPVLCLSQLRWRKVVGTSHSYKRALLPHPGFRHPFPNTPRMQTYTQIRQKATCLHFLRFTKENVSPGHLWWLLASHSEVFPWSRQEQVCESPH